MSNPKRQEAARPRRVQHAFLGPGTSIAEIPAQIAGLRCDMVEIDVLLLEDELVVAHSPRDFQTLDPLRLDLALSVLADRLPKHMRINLDLKLPGYEKSAAWSLRTYGLESRTLVSSMFLESLVALRQVAPEIRLGWSVPKARRNYLQHPVTKVAAYAVLPYYRRVLPGRAMRNIAAGFTDAVMAHWSVVTASLWEAIGYVGGDLYVWTVDDAARIMKMEALGVTGIISNDLSLFEALEQQQA